jgi:hypothetical protein
MVGDSLGGTLEEGKLLRVLSPERSIGQNFARLNIATTVGWGYGVAWLRIGQKFGIGGRLEVLDELEGSIVEFFDLEKIY